MFKVKASKQVRKFLNKLNKKEHERCLNSIKHLQKNPFQKRAKCDVRKLSGKKEVYRLRVGNYRFNYTIINGIIVIKEAFKRGRGYR